MRSNQQQIDLELLRQGNQHEFRRMLDVYGGMVLTLCKRVVRDENLAEEATQDVFVKCYKKLDSFKEESSLKTWIYRVAYRTAIDYVRKSKKRSTAHLEVAEKVVEMEENQEEKMIVKEKTTKLRKAIDRLAPEDATLLELYYFEEKNIKEVASITGMSTSNIKTKLFRARKSLRTILVKG